MYTAVRVCVCVYIREKCDGGAESWNKMMEDRKFSTKDLPSPTPFEVRAQPFRGRLPTPRDIDTLASCEHDTPSHSVDFVLEKYTKKTVKI